MKQARAGSEIIVTDRGVPVARLLPPLPKSSTLDDLIAQGLVEPPRDRRSRALPRRRVRLRGRGASMAEYVIGQRR